MRSCPFCESTNNTSISLLRSTPIEYFTNTREEALVVPKGNIDIVICEKCGFVFNQKYDDLLYWNNCKIVAVSNKSDKLNSHFQRIQKWLLALFEKDVSINCLEVGCGNGSFLHGLHKQTKWNLVGIDPIAPTIQEERFTLVSDYYSGYYEKKYDLIICRHVIEHIDDLKKLCVQFELSCNEGSYLYIETPDLFWSIDNIGVFDFFYEHCNYFYKETLFSLLEKYHFEIIDYRFLFDNQYIGVVTKYNRSKEKNDYHIPMKYYNKLRDYKKQEADLLKEWKTAIQYLSKNKKLGVLGGASKGNTFLNIVDPNASYIDYVYDYNPERKNKYMTGTGHKILDFCQETLRLVDVIIILNDAYYDECATKYPDKRFIKLSDLSV